MADTSASATLAQWLDDALRADLSAVGSDAVLAKLADAYVKDRGAYLACKEVLAARGMWRDVNTLVRKRVHESSGVQELRPGADEVRVQSVLDDAPVHPMAAVPRGWLLSRGSETGAPALSKIVQKKVEGMIIPAQVPVAHNPIVLTSWVANETTKRKMLGVAWCAGKWHESVVDRERLKDGGKIIDALAPAGFPVDSNTKADMVGYLSAYEARNVALLPVRSVSEQMGWQSDGSFLVGERCIGVKPGARSIEFLPPDAGERQLAQAVSTRGTFDAWKQAAAVLVDYPLAEVALYASLAAPVLKLLEAPVFVVDWSNETSAGKTTVLRVAASCWGNPGEGDDSMVMSWDATNVWIERAAAARCDLPLVIDDTKRAARVRGESVVPRVIYEICSGIGRGRGSIKGTQATKNWRTVMLSTGESRIIDESRDGGTVPRVVSLWGLPFGGKSVEHARLISDLVGKLAANYGHAGPAFVEWLIANQGEAGLWSEQRRELAIQYTETAPPESDLGICARVAGHLATLEVTARLVHRALNLPWKYVSPVERLIEIAFEPATEDDRSREALQYVYSWASARREQFWSNTHPNPNHDERTPSDGWLGRWDHDTASKPWETIDVYPDRLAKVLSSAGFSAKAIRRVWAARDWVVRNGKNIDGVVRIGGQMVRATRLSRQAVEAVCVGGQTA